MPNTTTRDPAEFDEFYRDARARLLLQTYALTGDLPASRAAVRDSFIVAWHHWRKVSCLEDPETSVRPHAWAHAQRRHTARVWHRDKSLDPEVKATLDALGKLPVPQRKVLLLTLLSAGSLADLAREVGLPREEAERLLQTASARFAVHRGIASTDVRAALEPLRTHTADATWPRATIIRRAGSARRRTHTALGVVGTVAALLVSGALVTQDGERRPALADPEQAPVLAGPSPVSAPQVALAPDNLLSADQVTRLDRKRQWSAGRTSDNSSGTGLVTPCRQERYADPDGAQTLVRRFGTTPEKKAPNLSAVQVSELSVTSAAAKTTYETLVGWYAGCVDSRMQLVSTHRVGRVGDEAALFVLRSWKQPVSTLVVGVARTGLVTTTTLSRGPGSAPVDTKAPTALLAAATNSLCGAPGAATCAGPPNLTEVAPYPVGEVTGMLSEVDLPPVARVDKPWVGTEVRKVTVNYAASGCARANFSDDAISNAVTRSFVIPDTRLPTEFGITETVGTMPIQAAGVWADRLRQQIDVCAGKELGTSVKRVVNRSGPRQDITVWHLTTEISDVRSVDYLMAVLRNGTAISQLGFIPARGVTMAPGAFIGVAERALVRLDRLPGLEQAKKRGPAKKGTGKQGTGKQGTGKQGTVSSRQ